ncbi:hypothetical protein NYZ94_06370 [Ligilactobacillus salivarius]|uniref:hypothetical protein n=1 Tax=Ligilactobacillus salivarius TaxID=1624 RepID=UPI000BAEA6E2|nr:hypothetical protein [Ligilactobacillus salivarius]MBE7387403.1 hypothetical protein [Ligilactobacillus salivarius]MBE7391797.1 hypothetical protein [Ligilactobacillus salivarius]PAY53233.1 hypothetical protein A8C37_05560 [Ligilactobacillus salivarius]QXL50025.1 hypothetical protein IGB11_03415 [Ligilactobacillus salivarius]UXI85493.1 hypothetical protein NYZ94_06370 [Ligilactobacillus salivarius]
MFILNNIGVFELLIKLIDVFDWGSIPDWISAVGTVSAVILSLMFAGSFRNYVYVRLESEVKTTENKEKQNPNYIKVTIRNLSNNDISLQCVKVHNMKKQKGLIDISAINTVDEENSLSQIQNNLTGTGFSINPTPIRYKDVGETMFHMKKESGYIIYKDMISGKKFKVKVKKDGDEWKIEYQRRCL